MLEMITAAPRSTKRVAVTWPILDPAPVTMPIFPSRRAIRCRSLAFREVR